MDSMDKSVTVIAGIGPGNGEAFARRFHAAGHRVALLARKPEFATALADKLGADARAFSTDVANPEALKDTFSAIRSELGPVSNLLYNAGSGVFGSIDDISRDALERAFAVNVLGLFTSVELALDDMRAAQAGSIIITGATASLRGGAGFAAFAPAKAAQRALAQSMARHLGPEGIHVALVIVDGMIDLPRTRSAMPDRPDEHFLKPRDIAETVYFLTQQPRSAWSFEVDVRPFSEKW